MIGRVARIRITHMPCSTVLTIALLLAPRGASNLGLARSHFGELAPSSKADGRYWYRNMWGDIPTQVFFPEGRSDERFFLNYYDIQTPPGSRQDDRQAVLTCEKKVGKKIVPQWIVLLDKLDDKGRTHYGVVDAFGTFGRYLGSRGLFIRKPVAAKVKVDLAALRGLAGYYSDNLHSSWVYYYVASTGTTGPERKLYSGAAPESSPTKPFAYPVTPEEAKLLSAAPTAARSGG